MALFLKIAALGVAISLGSGSAAIAQSMPSDSAPVIITKMSTFVDTDTKLRWVSCVYFKNNSAKTIQALRFLFTYYDAFDEPIQTFTADRVGEFAPGVAIEGSSQESLLGSNNCWAIFGKVPSLSKVSVETVKVRFADDGRVWIPPEPREKFTINTLETIDTRHPSSIVCNGGIAKIRYSWSYAHQVPICQKALRDWETSHEMPQPVSRNAPAPESSP